MELSVREAATLLECSPRTLRARLARGDLPGKKRGGRWKVHRRDLPLTETQRRRLQGKAERVRGAVEDVLPSRLASSSGERRRSLVDLDAFRFGAALLRKIQAANAEPLEGTRRERAVAHLEEALLAISEAAQCFNRSAKLDAIERGRSGFARALALLLLDAEPPLDDPLHGWVQSLETEVLPSVAGFARWAERLPSAGKPRERRR